MENQKLVLSICSLALKMAILILDKRMENRQVSVDLLSKVSESSYLHFRGTLQVVFCHTSMDISILHLRRSVGLNFFLTQK